jgi:hypothetical protein
MLSKSGTGTLRQVTTLSGSGSHERDRHRHQATGFQIGQRIGGPVIPVEIRCQKPARFIGQDGIYASHKFRAARSALIRSTQVTGNLVVGNCNERLIRTLATLDLWITADVPYPLILGGRRVAGFASMAIVPARRNDILPAGKQSPNNVIFSAAVDC